MSAISLSWLKDCPAPTLSGGSLTEPDKVGYCTGIVAPETAMLGPPLTKMETTLQGYFLTSFAHAGL